MHARAGGRRRRQRLRRRLRRAHPGRRARRRRDRQRRQPRVRRRLQRRHRPPPRRRGVDYVWLLNNDTTVEAETLPRMLDVAAGDERIGAVGSVIYDMAAPAQVLTWGGGRVGRRTGFTRDARSPQDRVDYLTGASLLLRTATLDDVGEFDPRFFFTWEDVDLGVRAGGGPLAHRRRRGVTRLAPLGWQRGGDEPGPHGAPRRRRRAVHAQALGGAGVDGAAHARLVRAWRRPASAAGRCSPPRGVAGAGVRSVRDRRRRPELERRRSAARVHRLARCRRRAPRSEIVVVDNGSVDDSLAVLDAARRRDRAGRRSPSCATQRTSASPAGSTAASPSPLDRGARAVALLNNDAVADPGWLARARRRARRPSRRRHRDVAPPARRRRHRRQHRRLLHVVGAAVPAGPRRAERRRCARPARCSGAAAGRASTAPSCSPTSACSTSASSCSSRTSTSASAPASPAIAPGTAPTPSSTTTRDRRSAPVSGMAARQYVRNLPRAARQGRAGPAAVAGRATVPRSSTRC